MSASRIIFWQDAYGTRYYLHRNVDEPRGWEWVAERPSATKLNELEARELVALYGGRAVPA